MVVGHGDEEEVILEIALGIVLGFVAINVAWFLIGVLVIFLSEL